MKKTLLVPSLLIGGLFSMNAQTVLFEDSFESYNDFIITGIGDWITLDLDGSVTYTDESATFEWPNLGDPQAFIIFNPAVAGVTNATSGAEVRNYDPKTGQKYAACWAAVMPGDGEGGAGPNNDWLISPAITLGGSQNEVKFWVKSMSNTYGLETYKVGVYVGNGTPTGASDFTIISGATNLTAPYPNWQEKTFSLDNYSNQTVRIGILCNSQNHYMFMVDDFSVTTASASVDSPLANSFSVYPNPAKEVLNISNTIGAELLSVTVTDLNGRTVKQINSSVEQINISDLNAGVYFVNINSTEGSLTKKIVKK